MATGANFSVPLYPGAVSYDIQYSDPISGNPKQPNRFGPWTDLSGSPFSKQSNIYDSAGDPALRLYRCSPTITLPQNASQTLQLPFFDAFSVNQPAPMLYEQTLYDPQITSLLPFFRDFMGDYGTPSTASTNTDLDTSAGDALLVPDGTTTAFNLDDLPDTDPPIILEYSVRVRKNGDLLALNTDYIVYWERGKVIFATAPAANDEINIEFVEVDYSNRQLCSALQTAIDSVNQYGINGYGIAPDNNVVTVNGTIGNNGLRPIIFTIALKALNRATIRKKSAKARMYKTGDFSVDTAPGRLIDGMSQQSNFDFQEIQSMATQYIKSATVPMVRDAYTSFFDISGILPVFTPLVSMLYGFGYQFWI